jgi:hypothetical protein
LAEWWNCDRPVQQRHGDAHRQPLAGGEQRPAAGRAVQEQRVVDAHVQRGQHPRLAVDDEPEVAEVGLVEDRVHHVGVVGDPLAQAQGGRAGSL